MQIKVKTLTGKEIEIDIEVSDKIERIKGILQDYLDSFVNENYFRASRRKRRNTTGSTETHFQWQAAQ